MFHTDGQWEFQDSQDPGMELLHLIWSKPCNLGYPKILVLKCPESEHRPYMVPPINRFLKFEMDIFFSAHLPKTWVLHRKISSQGADHHSLSSNLSAVDDVPLSEPLGVVFNLHWLVLWNMFFLTFQKIGKITLTDFHIFQRVETTNQSKSELGFKKE